MQIRNDFQPASLLLNRLVEYSKVFHRNNMDRWPHLRNNEDFRLVYRMPFEYKQAFENIYANGRDLAVAMSDRLVQFNYPEYFPTLKKFVDSFQNGWIYKINLLKEESQEAKDKAAKIEDYPWAVGRMISLYDEQIELLGDVKQTIDALKLTDIYKWESGTTLQIAYPTPEYDKILDCIHTIGRMFERLPNVYSGKGEEALRDHILASLETVVQGSATGETFNKRGKTDILVRGAGANEFVGECKFWNGKEAFLGTISQLLGYLSWRDTKTAVIIFVQNNDFSAVIEKMKTYVSEHPNFLRMKNERDETWCNYEFKMNEDTSRVVNLAVMLYHVP